MADDTDAPPPSLEAVQALLASAQARIKELNEEAKGHRLNAQNARGEAESLRKQVEDSTKSYSEKLAAAERAREEALVRANEARRDAALRLAAKDAGLVDMDALQLLDTSSITQDDSGAVVIPEDFFGKAKELKPYLFGTTSAANGTTSQVQRPPAAKPPTQRLAKDMTKDEWQAARDALVRQ